MHEGRKRREEKEEEEREGSGRVAGDTSKWMNRGGGCTMKRDARDAGRNGRIRGGEEG